MQTAQLFLNLFLFFFQNCVGYQFHSKLPVLREIEYFLGNCSEIFIDMGSNRGASVRKLYDVEFCRSAPLQTVFQKTFHNRRSVCTLAFEPNAVHHEILTKIKGHFTQKGHHVHVVHAGVSNETKNQQFFTNPEHEVQDGASIFLQSRFKNPASNKARIQLVSFSEVLRTVFSVSRSKVLIKMDIEGAEFDVLETAFFHDAICFLPADIYVEFHPRIFPRSEKVAGMDTFFKSIEKSVRNCRMNIFLLDDEKCASRSQTRMPASSGSEHPGGYSVSLFLMSFSCLVFFALTP